MFRNLNMKIVFVDLFFMKASCKYLTYAKVFKVFYIFPIASQNSLPQKIPKHASNLF